MREILYIRMSWECLMRFHWRNSGNKNYERNRCWRQDIHLKLLLLVLIIIICVVCDEGKTIWEVWAEGPVFLTSNNYGEVPTHLKFYRDIIWTEISCCWWRKLPNINKVRSKAILMSIALQNIRRFQVPYHEVNIGKGISNVKSSNGAVLPQIICGTGGRR